MKKVFSAILALTLVLTCLVGCANNAGSGGSVTGSGDSSGSTVAAPAEKITWKVQGYTAAGTLYDTYGKQLADSITEMAGGRLTIEWYAADSIVTVAEGPAAVRDGILDAVFDYTGVWSNVDEAFPLFCSSPGLFADPLDMVGWMYEGGGQDLWQKAMDDFNMNCHTILAGTHDMEDWMWSNKPIVEIDDMRGITTRMMPVMGNILSENGINVAFISGTEIVANMERGVIDAGEYSIPALDQTFGFQDVAKYVARPGFHQPCATQQLAINKDKWNALPDDLKAIVEYACQANVLNMMTNVTSLNVDSLDYFESLGITVTQLSDDAIKTLQEWTDAYYAKHAIEGTLMKEIIDSQNAYIKKIAAYKDTLEMPYPAWAYED